MNPARPIAFLVERAVMQYLLQFDIDYDNIADEDINVMDQIQDAQDHENNQMDHNNVGDILVQPDAIIENNHVNAIVENNYLDHVGDGPPAQQEPKVKNENVDNHSELKSIPQDNNFPTSHSLIEQDQQMHLQFQDNSSNFPPLAIPTNNDLTDQARHPKALRIQNLSNKCCKVIIQSDSEYCSKCSDESTVKTITLGTNTYIIYPTVNNVCFVSVITEDGHNI